MKINKIKNILIIVLVFVAVFQTGNLWLEGSGGRNFFTIVFNGMRQGKGQGIVDGKVLLPTVFAVGDGSRKFMLTYPEEKKNTTLMEGANDLLTEVMADGTAKEPKSGVDWDSILTSKCLVFQYDFMLPVENYLKEGAFGGKKKGMNYFDQIALVPAKDSGEKTKVFLVNSSTDYVMEISLERSRYAAVLYRGLNLREDALIYASTGQSGFKLFESNVFVPQWAESTLPYQKLERVNPFEKDGVINRGLLENAIGGFFKNFAADWSTKDETGTFMFSDETVVVKYAPKKNILEYYSYDTYENGKKDSLIEGYGICLNFLKNDKSLQTGIYLSKIKERSSETTYYFDYEVGDFPILIADELANEMGSHNAIEIVVKNHAVKKYRRYAYNFQQGADKNGSLEVDFLTALNQAIVSYQQRQGEDIITSVEDIRLCYYLEKIGDLELKWKVKLYGTDFIGSGKKTVE